MRREPDETLLLTKAYARSKSFTVAMQALRYIVEYGRACDIAGEEIDVKQYSEHVGVSLAQAYRRRGAYETCFPSQGPLSVWEIVKPLLDASKFKNEGPRAQAVFIGTIVATWSTP